MIFDIQGRLYSLFIGIYSEQLNQIQFFIAQNILYSFGFYQNTGFFRVWIDNNLVSFAWFLVYKILNGCLIYQIFDKKYFSIMNCVHCKKPLAGKYFKTDKGPMHPHCMEETSEKCFVCGTLFYEKICMNSSE